jgi:predicted SnoaL-like aldol condensation-catalyzing enzyme
MKSRSRSLADNHRKHREKAMKIRLVVALAGLAISFALPAFAQEKEEVNPFPLRAIAATPQLVQQLEAINLKLDEAFNKHDATAIAALYIANAIQVTPVGIFSGREAIEKFYTDVFQRYTPSDHVRKISYVYAFGGDLCAIGGWTDIVHGSQPAGGYFLNVFTHPGDAEVLKYQPGR